MSALILRFDPNRPRAARPAWKVQSGSAAARIARKIERLEQLDPLQARAEEAGIDRCLEKLAQGCDTFGPVKGGA
jgi:hypothetical protein